MLDIHRPITSTVRRGDQQVGFAHPPSCRIGGQSAPGDDQHPLLHHGQRRCFPSGPVPIGHHMRVWMKADKLSNHLLFELAATGEPALNEPRYRRWRTRLDRVPLGTDRALLGHITAPRWHCRNVIASDHRSDGIAHHVRG